MNDQINGIPISNTLHNGDHPYWNGQIAARLKTVWESNPNMSPEDAYDKVKEIADKARASIIATPGKHINQITINWY